MDRWYCVQSIPHKEFWAQANLTRLGFDVLLLTEQRTRRYRGGVTKQLMAPLFGSYLFVPFDIDDPTWRRIPSAYGVRRILSANAETPIAVPDHTIDSLLSCVVEYDEQTEAAIIHPGCKAKVVKGPLAQTDNEISGICQWTHNRRVALLLDMINGAVEVVFDVDSLELMNDGTQTTPSS